jgi:hypothetical protein
LTVREGLFAGEAIQMFTVAGVVAPLDPARLREMPSVPEPAA